MHRADHVVEPVRLKQPLGSRLRARHVVHLEPEAQIGLLAHVGAVCIQVVVRLLQPERVAPHIERLAEAVDVLRDAELLDSPRARGAAVARRVRRREVLLRCRLERVGAQVKVIVGEHETLLRWTAAIQAVFTRSAVHVRSAAALQAGGRAQW